MAQTSSTAAPKKNHTASKFTAVAIELPSEKVAISNDAIAALAYEKYESRGRIDGFDQEDWAAAIAELVTKTG